MKEGDGWKTEEVEEELECPTGPPAAPAEGEGEAAAGAGRGGELPEDAPLAHPAEPVVLGEFLPAGRCCPGCPATGGQGRRRLSPFMKASFSENFQKG